MTLEETLLEHQEELEEVMANGEHGEIGSILIINWFLFIIPMILSRLRCAQAMNSTVKMFYPALNCRLAS